MRGGKPESAGPVCALEEPPIIEMESFGPMRADEATPAPFLARGCTPPADLARGLMRSPKFLPCRFLYDDLGSQLYEQITCLPEYYVYSAEKELLSAQAGAIATHIPNDSVIVELGCGDSSKTAILLEALLRRLHGLVSGTGEGGCRARSAGPEGWRSNGSSNSGSSRGSSRGEAGWPPLRFVGVDVSAEALRQTARNLARLLPELPPEQVELVEGEYLQGIRRVRQRHPDAFLTVLWLGSSVGNFSPAEAVPFLTELRDAAGEHSQLLLGADRWKDAEVLRQAYDDSQGVSAAFILNGMHHALRTLGHPYAGDPSLFQYEPEVNPKLQQVEMWVRARRRVPDVLRGLHIEAGERVLVEVSRKFTTESVAAMAFAAGFCQGGAWSGPAYGLHLLQPPAVALERCWNDTDSLFACLADWEAQPIGLRRPFFFYLAHCAAFTKLKLLPNKRPSELDHLFSRGIDPLVQDPSRCHDHPATPQCWPNRAQVEAYVASVRREVLSFAGKTVAPGTSAAGSSAAGEAEAVERMRRLCMVCEHERQHQETLCYMAAQQRKADAAAIAAGRRPVLAVPGGGGAAAQAAAGATLPLYLQQCSYASASTRAAPLAFPASNTLRQSRPWEPGTPARQAETLPRRLAALQLGGSRAGHNGRDAGPADGGDDFVTVPGGEVSLGVPPASERGFLWDCEVGRQGPVQVEGLRVGAGPVTVAQFRRFVFEDQGYLRRELWDDQAWRHLAASGHSMPASWSLQVHSLSLPGPAAHAPAVPDGSDGSSPASPTADGSSAHGGQQLWVHMPEGSYRWEHVADCPVYVSLAEAQAYAKLHGARLLTEPEWQLAMDSKVAAAGALRQLDSGGWEWTATPFAPLPGYQPDPLYQEYSSDFFDGEHFTLRGASPATHPAVARRSFRNFYQQLYPFVFAKFRLARPCSSSACCEAAAG
ncbi:hypothetical protein ABPG77_007268 [Micractinium sp. CCAP 211/92]